MSKEIRSLIESIKKDQAPSPIVAVEPILPPSVKTLVLEEKPVESIEKKIKTEKKVEKTPESVLVETTEMATEPTVIKVEAAETAPKPEAKPKSPKPVAKAKIVAEPTDFETFFAQLNEADFQLEQKTVANIDNRFYEIFMSLKRKKKVKNVSLIVNGILKEYIERHKEEIIKTMSEGNLV
jgi:hypothetical protein